MLVKSKAPEKVNYGKIYEWQESTPTKEGLNIIYPFAQITQCNWVLFYCWCYSRTKGFTDNCLNRFDVGNHGGNFMSFSAGVQNSLSFFLAYKDTSQLDKPEEKETLEVYHDVLEFCDAWDYDPPHPLPTDPIPLPPDTPKPQPPPGKIEIPIDWPWIKSKKAIIIACLTALATIAILFPGWVKMILEALIKILDASVKAF